MESTSSSPDPILLKSDPKDHALRFLADASDKQAWHKARKGRISGSTMAAILQVSPWSRPEDLFKHAARLNRWDVALEHAEEFNPPNIYMQLGTDYEDTAQACFERVFGVRAYECNTALYGLPSDPDRFCATPDGLVGKETVLELKTSFGKSPLPKSVPIYYFCQVMLEMACTQRKRTLLVYWRPTHVTPPGKLKAITETLVVFEIMYDADVFETYFLEPCRWFLDRTGELPKTATEPEFYAALFPAWDHVTAEAEKNIRRHMKRLTRQIELPEFVADPSFMRKYEAHPDQWYRAGSSAQHALFHEYTQSL